MPDVSDIATRVEQFLSVHLHLDIPSADMDLFDAGVLDSLAFVELLLSLEREFGVQVSIEELELEHFRSIERIAEFVASRANPNGGPPAERQNRAAPPDTRVL